MYIPKIIFRYAYPLDRDRRDLYAAKNFGDYPDTETVKAKAEEWQKLWDKSNENDKIVSRFVELFGLTLTRDVECYVIGDGFRAISIPFILPIISNKQLRPDDNFVEAVVHELAHNFAASHIYNPQVKNYWLELRKNTKTGA